MTVHCQGTGLGKSKFWHDGTDVGDGIRFHNCFLCTYHEMRRTQDENSFDTPKRLRSKGGSYIFFLHVMGPMLCFLVLSLCFFRRRSLEGTVHGRKQSVMSCIYISHISIYIILALKGQTLTSTTYICVEFPLPSFFYGK